MTPAIIEIPWQGLFAGVNNTDNKFIAGVVNTGEQLIAGVVDTSDNIQSEYLRKFSEKILNGPNGTLGGPGDKDSWKNLKSKISCQTPFKKSWCYSRFINA